MPEAKLRATLEQLKAELESADALSDTDAALLEEVSDRIERLLDETHETRAAEAPIVQEHVGGALERFEAEHPELTRLLGALANTLASIGL